jgi:hypothetical protein
MATTKIRSSSITDGQVDNADLSATVAVTGGQIADDAVTLAKMADGTDGNLITYDASGDPAYVATGSATHVLTSNGAGAAPTFQAAAAGENAPAWHVGMNSVTQTIADATTVKVELDEVKFDTGFTWDTVNYRGIPGTAGKYLIGCFASFDPAGDSWINAYTYLYKNGVSQAFWGWQIAGNDFRNGNLGGTTILDLGATDYVEMFVYIDYNLGPVTLRQLDSTQCVTYMFGTKLIGA